jgi:hypothetical protein
MPNDEVNFDATLKPSRQRPRAHRILPHDDRDDDGFEEL